MKRVRLTWIAYAIMICSLTTFAQPDTVWTRTHNVEGHNWEIIAVDNAIVCFSFREVHESEALWHYESAATKLSANGDTIWTTQIVTPSPRVVVVAAVTGLEGELSILAARHDSIYHFSPFLIRISQNGVILESIALPASTSWRTLDNAEDGSLWLAGEVPGFQGSDLRLMKMSRAGVMLWEHTFIDSTYSESVTALEPCSAGALVVGSRWNSFTSSYPVARLFNSDGELVWMRTIEDEVGFGTFHDACCVPEGGFLIIGNRQTFPHNSPGWFVRLSETGDTLWTREEAEGALDNSSAPLRIFRTIDDAYCVVGTLNEYAEPWIIKFRENGSVVFRNCCWADGEYTQANCAAQLSDGTYFMGGRNFVLNGYFPYLVRFADDISSDLEDTPEISNEFALHPNHPNPFNASTEITFDLPRALQTSLKVYDVLGREVAEVAGGVMSAGSHTIIYDASGLSSGVYFYRLEAGEFGETRKMVLLR